MPTPPAPAPKSALETEPVIIIGSIVTILTIVQQLALTQITSGVHAVIAAILIVAGAVLTRLKVTPA